MNQGDRNDKQISLSYLQQLQIDCDVGFDRFWANLRASASDAELVVAYHSLKDPRDHAVDLYKAVLTAKLDAYKKSGVEDIGRKARLDREYHVGTIHRDTRVIWVKNPFSEGKKLYFQSQEGDFNPTFLEKDDPGTEWMPENYHLRTIGPRKFGARDPRESPKLEKVVPVEFQEAAIARSEQIYGPTETVDPNDWLRRQGIDPDLVFRGTKQQDQRADLKGSEPDARSLTPFPPGSVFNSSPPAYPAGSVFNKTSDDVGDDLLQAYAGPIDFSSGKEP
jgi:hypothetical protein